MFFAEMFLDRVQDYESFIPFTERYRSHNFKMGTKNLDGTQGI